MKKIIKKVSKDLTQEQIAELERKNRAQLWDDDFESTASDGTVLRQFNKCLEEGVSGEAQD